MAITIFAKVSIIDVKQSPKYGLVSFGGLTTGYEAATGGVLQKKAFLKIS